MSKRGAQVIKFRAMKFDCLDNIDLVHKMIRILYELGYANAQHSQLGDFLCKLNSKARYLMTTAGGHIRYCGIQATFEAQPGDIIDLEGVIVNPTSAHRIKPRNLKHSVGDWL